MQRRLFGRRSPLLDPLDLGIRRAQLLVRFEHLAQELDAALFERFQLRCGSAFGRLAALDDVEHCGGGVGQA